MLHYVPTHYYMVNIDFMPSEDFKIDVCMTHVIW